MKPKLRAVRIVQSQSLANVYLVAERDSFSVEYFNLPAQPIRTAHETAQCLAAFLGVPFEPPEVMARKDICGYPIPQ